MIDQCIQDQHINQILHGFLDDPAPTAEVELCVESILNGSVRMETYSCTAFYYCLELLEFGFPSSKSQACKLNRTMFDRLIAKGIERGLSRRDMIAKFLLVWAAMDGSIFTMNSGTMMKWKPFSCNFWTNSTRAFPIRGVRGQENRSGRQVDPLHQHVISLQTRQCSRASAGQWARNSSEENCKLA